MLLMWSSTKNRTLRRAENNRAQLPMVSKLEWKCLARRCARALVCVEALVWNRLSRRMITKQTKDRSCDITLLSNLPRQCATMVLSYADKRSTREKKQKSLSSQAQQPHSIHCSRAGSREASSLVEQKSLLTQAP